MLLQWPSDNTYWRAMGASLSFQTETVPLLRVLLVLVAINAFIHSQQGTYIPEAYMDEEFHIPQAQRFCSFKGADYIRFLLSSNISEDVPADRKLIYDPQITTPPGLYAYSLSLYKILENSVLQTNLSKYHWLCSVASLRITNVVLHVSLLLLFFGVSRSLFPQQSVEKHAIRGFICCIFPPLHFYSHLYYTDIGGIVFVLAAYLLSLKGKYVWSSLLGGVSMFFRQTNAIWVFWILCTYALRSYYDHISDKNILVKMSVSKQIFNTVMHSLRSCKTAVLCYLAPLEAFGYWVVYMNGGSVALGHQEYHSGALHITQSVYLVLILFGSTFPEHLYPSQLIRTYATFRKYFVVLFAAMGGWIAWAISTEYIHPFLLADNRHLTFYWVHRVVQRFPNWILYISPLLVWIHTSLWTHFSRWQTRAMTVVTLTAMLASVVVFPLLEVRYFLLPYVIYVLHIWEFEDFNLSVRSLIYVVIAFVQWYIWWLVAPVDPQTGKAIHFMY